MIGFLSGDVFLCFITVLLCLVTTTMVVALFKLGRKKANSGQKLILKMEMA